MVEQPIGNNFVTEVLAFVTSYQKYDVWFFVIAEYQYIAPVTLNFCQHVVHLQCLFFLVEYIDDYAHEHVEEEKVTHNNKEKEEDIGKVKRCLLFRHHVYLSCVLSILHHTDPPFSCHYIE